MVNYEIFQHAEFTSSPNSFHHLCQTQHEVYYGTDREIHKFYKERVEKKHNIGTAQDLEVVNLSDIDNKNAAIDDERRNMSHNNSD